MCRVGLLGLVISLGWASPRDICLKRHMLLKPLQLLGAVVALTHFKGHSMGVIGGALKNLGIGAQSKRGSLTFTWVGTQTHGLGAAGVFHPENFKGKAETPDWEILEDCFPFDLITSMRRTNSNGMVKMCELFGVFWRNGPQRLDGYPSSTV
ncbi:MAG: hypothetical protein CM1200mP3_15010 [Chloroflexota bacterium]|nr:MAG: hypothetical protein CM1200mP3_15010 [Chloroflexota bacterium]